MLLELHQFPLTSVKTVADKARYFDALNSIFFNGLGTINLDFQSSALPTELPGLSLKL